MPLSHFGEFDGDFTASQFAAQSPRSLRAVSAHSQRSLSAVSVELHSMANPLRMRCKLISTNVDEKKIIHFHDKKAGKTKEQKFI